MLDSKMLQFIYIAIHVCYKSYMVIVEFYFLGINYVFVMATRIPGSVNADSRTIQIILLSHSGRKRVNIRFCLFIY